MARHNPPTGQFIRQKMRRTVKIIPIVLASMILSCGQDGSPVNVVLIGVDTLRPDHMSCYGYDRNTTPNVDRIARKGILFEDVIAPSPWTLPSFASVFTSLYPSQHGAVNAKTPLGDGFPTLAELLKAEGYATGAIINAPYLKKKYEMDRGFDVYGMRPPEGRSADGTTRDALDWISGIADQPFFIFIHYFDPHLPYAPPAPYDTVFNPDYQGRIQKPYNPRRLPSYRPDNFKPMKAIPPEDWNQIKSLYDGEVAFTDDAIGELIEGLRDLRLHNETLIIFISDHGEEFFDHEGFEHGHTLYDELIRVPMIFSLPGRLPEQERIGRQVRLIDVAPTVLDLLGLESHPGFEGVSLKPFLEDERSVAATAGPVLPPELAYSECILYGGEKKSLTSYPWKLIYDMMTGRKKCFNLADDPGEMLSIADPDFESLFLLEETLYNTLINLTDTWFVELAAGGDPHRFDVDIACNVVKGPGWFDLRKVIASSGDIIDIEDLDGADIGRSTMTIKALSADEPIRLAFKLHRKEAPIRFDIRIDGEPAAECTYVGAQLLKPVTMPFIEQDSPEAETDKGEPVSRPDPPYCLVWLAKAGYGTGRTIELDEETEQELRSLGYIQ
jgi:arylsulfatase A-like enzyme